MLSIYVPLWPFKRLQHFFKNASLFCLKANIKKKQMTNKPVTNKPTCAILSIFIFHYDCFWNVHVFNLLFNKCHLDNSMSHGSQMFSVSCFCMFGPFVLFNMRKTVNRKKYKSESNLLFTYEWMNALYSNK